MYRNKSAVSLRTLAHSLKHSITIDRQKAQIRQFIPLRNSASTINLIGQSSAAKSMTTTNNKNTKPNEEYLIMLESRKPNPFAESHQCNRNSNYSQLRYDIKATKELMIQRKERLLEMTKAQSIRRFPLASQSRTFLPQPLRQTDELTCTLGMLQQEQSRLKQIISQKYVSNNLKSCNKHIIDSEIVGNQLKEISAKYNQFIEYKAQLENRVMFLDEEILSTKMNFNQHVAEKDQCEQFLQTYQEDTRFREEAEHVMKLVAIEYENENQIQTKITKLQRQRIKVESEFNDWKIEQKIQFKLKKFHNKLKQLRLQLMKVQTDLDSITNQLQEKYYKQDVPRNTIKKVREYICTFFRNHTNANSHKISYTQIDDGMDFFLCKNHLVKQFTHFLNQSTSNISLTHGIYSLKITQYCDCLQKIQQLFYLHNTEVHKLVSDKFEQQISSIKDQIQELNEQKSQNLSQIKSLLHTIQKILSQDSLSIIELMGKKTSSTYVQFNKQQGLFNLDEIKSKVKEGKLQQQKRIMKAKQNFMRLKQLEYRLNIYSQQNTKNQLKWTYQRETLVKQIKLWQQKIRQIYVIKQGYKSKKTKLESIVDEAIAKIKEKDQAEQKLSFIQTEIDQLKKQKIEQITKKHQSRKTNQQFTCLNQTKTKLRPFSSVSNLNQHTQKEWPTKLGSFIPETLLQLGTLKLNQNQQINQSSQEKSAEFKITRDLGLQKVKVPTEEQKMSTKTQSSPKNCQQRLSLGALNSILLSKCNLVHSKNLQTQSKLLMRSGSTYGGNKINKENELKESELLLESKSHSRKTSKIANKQSLSRKNSVTKNTQVSTTKNQTSNLSTGTKLSLSTNNRRIPNNKTPRQSRQSPYTKPIRTQKDLDRLITSKLLRR